jgi:hypothetical protein
MRWLLVVLACAVGCKERGTITIDLMPQCNGSATMVRFQAIKDGTCDACTCATCTCTNTTDQQCIASVPCDGAGCPVAEVQKNGIDWEPPSAGRYALTYEFLDGNAGPAAAPVAIVCTEITVDADGTSSSTEMPAPTCCS